MVLIFVFAALITPPDVVSQLMLAGPMLLLMQLSYWICCGVEKSRKRKEAKEAQKAGT